MLMMLARRSETFKTMPGFSKRRPQQAPLMLMMLAQVAFEEFSSATPMSRQCPTDAHDARSAGTRQSTRSGEFTAEADTSDCEINSCDRFELL